MYHRKVKMFTWIQSTWESSEFELCHKLRFWTVFCYRSSKSYNSCFYTWSKDAVPVEDHVFNFPSPKDCVTSSENWLNEKVTHGVGMMRISSENWLNKKDTQVSSHSLQIHGREKRVVVYFQPPLTEALQLQKLKTCTYKFHVQETVSLVLYGFLESQKNSWS